MVVTTKLAVEFLDTCLDLALKQDDCKLLVQM